MSSRTIVYTGGTPCEPITWEPMASPEAHPEPQPALRQNQEPAATASGEHPALLAEHLKVLQQQAKQAEEEMRRKLEEAYQKGRAEGRVEGRAEGRAEIEPAVERLAKSVQELAALRPRLRRESEVDLVKLAVAIARRILHREITLDPDALQALVRVMLDRLSSQEIIRVRVHPQLEPLIRRLCPSQADTEVEILADKSMEIGGMVFETERGKLDASVETQLEEIERGLTDRIG